ncbi:MAG: hypothetical protein VW554_03995 [Alphaproteobacteria bacterium]
MSNQSRYKRFQRPETLFGLFAPMVALPGVGDKLASVLKKKVGNYVIDLLRHLPVGVIDRTRRPNIPDIEHGSCPWASAASSAAAPNGFSIMFKSPIPIM